jgi:hypothetical protein
MTPYITALASLGLLLATLQAQPPTGSVDPKRIEECLIEGALTQGEKKLEQMMRANPGNDQVRFGTGVAQFLRCIERLVQDLYRLGLKPADRWIGPMVPFLRLPLPENAQPEKVTYAALRKMMEDFGQGMQKAEQTLASIKDAKLKLPVHVAQIQFDLTGQGKEFVSIGRLLQQFGLRMPEDDQAFYISFDRADVAWLRGYSHLLQAFTDFALAYDMQQLFDATAHIFFKNVDSPHGFLKGGRQVFGIGGGETDIADLIAFIHLIRFPLKDAAKMKSALEHLETMLRLSREMWQLAQQEDDDDHEWIPNPKQHGALRVNVTEEMMHGWLGFVGEAEALLQGKKLIPFWRGPDDGTGVNLRKVFTEPTPFDLVLWIQGTAATPYLEKGNLTNSRTWSQLDQVFRGQFFGFAVWFN